jgi:DNA-binding PadR family transcriptional regulator
VKSRNLPTLSAKERLILGRLIESGPKYGLQLVDESRGALKRGTVYVTLGRMEQKGLVESHHEPATKQSDAIPRRMYRVTGLGRRVFDAWTMVARAFSMEPGR